METREKHTVTFFCPGTFFSETSTYDIESWDPQLAARQAAAVVVRYGARPYGFRFETHLVADPVSDGRGGKLQVEPRKLRESELYHLDGKIETYDDFVARADPKEDIARRNMRDHAPIVCVTTHSYRSTQPFGEKDVMVDAHGNIVERGDTPERIAYRERIKREYTEELRRTA